MTYRRLSRIAVATLVPVLLATATPAVASPTTGIRVTLPPPSYHSEIGTVSLHLIDRSRPDPWVASPAYRELMVSVWYPALPSRGHPLARYLPRGAAGRFGAAGVHGIPPGRVDWAAVRTHAREAAPVDPRGGRRPVVLYSPGSADPRAWGTVLVEDLASRGYVVLTIDHTYESPAVQFPDGSVKGNEPVLTALARAVQDGTVPALLEKVLRVRVDDTRFVLDRLATLPGGLSRVVDPDRVGMFGQSAGGITAAQGMFEDRRIKAGIDLDGTLEYNREPNGTNLMPVAIHGLDRPFLLMGRHGSNHLTEPSWRAFWSHSRGWKRDLTLRGSRHQTYTDLTAILPQTRPTQNIVERQIGTIDPVRALAAQRAYVASFFDRWLHGHDGHLLDRPSPCYPEMVFVP